MNTSKDNRDGSCRVVMMGVPGVGKTAITVRFMTKRFIGEYCPTLENVYKCQKNIDNDNVKLEIFDTAGETNGNQTSSYAKWGDAFLFIYSIADRQTFDELTTIKDKLLDNQKSSSTSTCPPLLAIVGNKGDLSYERKISSDEGQQLAASWNCRFYEVSAADGGCMSRIEDIFRNCYKEYVSRNKGLNRLTTGESTGTVTGKQGSAKFKQVIRKIMIGRMFISTKASNSSGSSQ